MSMIISQSSPSSRIVTGTSGLGILQSGLLVLRLKLKDSVSSKLRSSRILILRGMGPVEVDVNVTIGLGKMLAL